MVDHTDTLAGEPADSGPRWLLPALLVVGAAVRLIGLGTFPFDQDELYSVMEATYLWDSPLHPGIEARPLYYLLQHVVLAIWPATHISMRAIPFIFGVAGIWLTWKLGRTVGGWVGAAVATALIIACPWHLYASGMARYWSLVYMMAAGAYLLLWKGHVDDRPRLYLAAVGAIAIGTLSHPTFLFPVLSAAGALAFIKRDGSFGLPIPTRNALLYFWIPLAAFLLAGYVALSLTAGESAVQNWAGRGFMATVRLIPAMIQWASTTLAVAGGIGILISLRDPSIRGRTWGFMALIGIAGCLALLLAASFRTDVYADYGISALPLLVVSAGGLAAAVARESRFSPAAVATATTLLVWAGMAPSTVSHLVGGTRFDFRPAFERIEATAPDVAVLANSVIIQMYYAPDLDATELPMTVPELDAALRKDGDLWAVVPFRRYGIPGDYDGSIAAWFVDHCHLDMGYEKPRLDYRRYRTELYRCSGS